MNILGAAILSSFLVAFVGIPKVKRIMMIIINHWKLCGIAANTIYNTMYFSFPRSEQDM